MKRTPIQRHAELQRRAFLRAVNRKRKAKRHAKAFGEKAAWVRALPCLVCGAVPSDPAHVRSRGAGGTAADLVPLCRAHHTEQHTIGVRTFAARHNLDLRAEADRLTARWEEAA